MKLQGSLKIMQLVLQRLNRLLGHLVVIGDFIEQLGMMERVSQLVFHSLGNLVMQHSLLGKRQTLIGVDSQKLLAEPHYQVLALLLFHQQLLPSKLLNDFDHFFNRQT